MPGTLMLEGCLQAHGVLPGGARAHARQGRLALRAGPRDRLSPALPRAGDPLDASSRTRSSSTSSSPGRPRHADLLGTVDGLKAFHAAAWACASSRAGRSTRATADAVRAAASGRPEASRGRRRVRVRPAVAPRLRLGPALGGASASMYGSLRRGRRARAPAGAALSLHVARPRTSTARRAACRSAAPWSRSSTTCPGTPGTSSENGHPSCRFACSWRSRSSRAAGSRRYVGTPLSGREELLLPQPRRHRHVILERFAATSARSTVAATLTQLSSAGSMVIVGFQGEVRRRRTPRLHVRDRLWLLSRRGDADQPGLPPATGGARRSPRRRPCSSPSTSRRGRCAGRARGCRRDGCACSTGSRACGPTAGGTASGAFAPSGTSTPETGSSRPTSSRIPSSPDPLGMEAMMQALQIVLLERISEEVACDPPFRRDHHRPGALVWKYRGQVLPEDALITVDLDVTARGVDDAGPVRVGRGIAVGRRQTHLRGPEARCPPRSGGRMTGSPTRREVDASPLPEARRPGIVVP